MVAGGLHVGLPLGDGGGGESQLNQGAIQYMVAASLVFFETAITCTCLHYIFGKNLWLRMH